MTTLILFLYEASGSSLIMCAVYVRIDIVTFRRQKCCVDLHVMSASYNRIVGTEITINPEVKTVQMKMPRVCGPKLSNCCFVISIWGIVMLVSVGKDKIGLAYLFGSVNYQPGEFHFSLKNAPAPGFHYQKLKSVNRKNTGCKIVRSS